MGQNYVSIRYTTIMVLSFTLGLDHMFRYRVIKIIVTGLFFILHTAIYAGVSIDISAEPSLPSENLIHDAGFEEGIWKGGNYYKGKGEVRIVKEHVHSGENSLCFMGFSKDAKGQALSREFLIYTDIPYSLDFWIRSYRDVPEGGVVSLRYYLDDADKTSGSVDAQIASLVKIPERWILFSNPPKDITAETLMLFWQPTAKDAKRHYKSIRNNIIIFPKKDFANQERIRVRLCISASGLGVVWYDDIILKPLKSRLRYTVKGNDVSEIKVLNKKGEILKTENFSGDWSGEYSGTLLVPAGSKYRIEVKTKSGEINYVEYPGKKTN